jgi:endonuclease/exonuclease/phosphatase family metal-dependent hydrolase
MLKILSYNILYGGEDRLDSITQVIHSHHPDAVALLEANSLENARRLAADLSMDLYYGEANSEFAVAWLSRLPVEGWRNHRREIFAKTLLEIEVAWEGSRLPLFAAHLVAGPNVEVEAQRVEEVRAILEVMERCQGRPHLLVGDLNATHPGDSVGEPPPGLHAGYISRKPIAALLAAGYVDCYRALHLEEPGYTHPANAPWLRLDYLFASPSLAARLAACDLDARDLAQRASDHLPVWVEFGGEQ